MTYSNRRLDDSSVFAQQMQKDVFNAATISADVLSRQSATRSGTAVAHFQFGDKKLTLSYPDCGVGMPKWLPAVVESLLGRWGTEAGWDGYSAKPTNQNYVDLLLTNLFPLMQHNSLPPIIMPLADGGVQAEWHKNGVDLEIEFSASRTPTYYFYNAETGKEEEGRFDHHFAHIREIISKL